VLSDNKKQQLAMLIAACWQLCGAISRAASMLDGF